MNKYLQQAEQSMSRHSFLEAAALCRKAIRSPADAALGRKLLADCYYNQGVIDMFGSGLIEDAEAHFKLALEFNPRHALAANNLAGLLQIQGALEEAIPHYRNAIRADPTFRSAYRDLATVLHRLDRIDEASAVLAQLDARSPDDASALLRDALLVCAITPDPEYPHRVRQRIEEKLADLGKQGRRIDNALWFPGTYFYLSYHGLCNKELHQRIAQAHLEANPELAWTSPHIREWQKPEGRIRIGLASAYFQNHSIGHTSGGFVDQLDRTRFEVVVLRLGKSPDDAVARAIDQAADQIVHVPVDDLRAARSTIADLKLDILFWQDIGMEPVSYLLAFARLAPMQLTSYGHPDTTGIPNVDYFLSTDLYESADGASGYSEKLVCVKNAGTLSYYKRPVEPTAAADRAEFGLDDGDHIYLCAQALFKIHTDMDDIFAAIVEQDAKARIVLIDPVESHMRERLANRLANRSAALAERLVFVPRLRHASYLQLIRCADVMLDTVHFNGQNTSLEGFAMGVPIVTLPGPLQRSRHTAGMYRAMNFPDLVAKDSADYVAKALAVANDPGFRARCVRRIAAASGCLYENRDFIRQCEAIFEVMVAEVAGRSGKPA